MSARPRSASLVGLMLFLSLMLAGPAPAQSTGDPVAVTDQDQLARIAERARQDEASLRGKAYADLLNKVAGPMAVLLDETGLELMGVLPSGRPLFYATDNLDAAITVNTDAVWPGGWAGLDLTGANVAGSLGIWDGGAVRTTHQEFQGRVTVGDGSPPLSDHATHVAGTMIAAGIDSEAIGMSPAASLVSYDWGQDTSEMAAAASGSLRLSNHSYGFVAGWRYSWNGVNEWFWFGDPAISELEDPGFGFYNGKASDWDDLSHAAPYYLIVKSAGNDRNDFGPDPGGGHYVWSYSEDDWAWSTLVRDPDGGTDGYDSIPYHGSAKNILTVGAVHDIDGGWTSPADVEVSDFSGWGPTDDGRIKPDLVANGVSLLSSLASGDSDYASYSGTSMSAPNVSGSLNLLVQQHQGLHGGLPLLASSLKAIVLHTASEAGPAPGPDYMHGWGLLNTAAAALLIADDGAGGRRLREATLAGGATDVYRFYHDGEGELKVSLVWTDLPGTPLAWSLNPPTPLLVNDLDLRLIRESDEAVFYPWLLDPANPSAPATTGPNHRDNVEIIQASGASAGTYRVEVSHTGTLVDSQVYSLVQTGLESISLTTAGLAPATPRLLHAAPNPFNPRTEIAFRLEQDQDVRLAVFDARGRRVAELAADRLPAGEHRVAWDGRDLAGRSAAAGVYLVRLTAGTTVDHLRISLIK